MSDVVTLDMLCLIDEPFMKQYKNTDIVVHTLIEFCNYCLKKANLKFDYEVKEWDTSGLSRTFFDYIAFASRKKKEKDRVVVLTGNPLYLQPANSGIKRFIDELLLTHCKKLVKDKLCINGAVIRVPQELQDIACISTGNKERPMRDIMTTTVHEIGHTFGLNHSRNPDSVMHRYCNDSVRDYKFSDEEIKQITENQRARIK